MRGGSMEENFRIGIIGGAGKMGKLFQNFFQKRGYEVLISDKGIGLSLEELLEKGKVILLSLPLEVFPQVVKEMAPLVSDSHWIIDICSLKYEPAKVMKTLLKRGELLATHPLFGPFEKDLTGKTIAYYPLRGKHLSRWFLSLLEKEGLKAVKISPKKHDKIMALVQVLNHFLQILIAKTIRDSGFSLQEIFSLSTPSFLKQLEILRRLAKQDENLYAYIQLNNPFGAKYRSIFCKNCNSLNKAFKGEKASSLFIENFRLAKEIAQELEKLFSVEEN